MAVLAAILFALGLLLRLIDGTTLHDPWVYAFAGLLCLSLAGVLTVPWPRRG